MSHKKSNEELRDQRLIGDLGTALDSAAWQAEESRQETWGKTTVRGGRGESDDFDITKIIEDELRG
jgi:hypothetical protein